MDLRLQIGPVSCDGGTYTTNRPEARLMAATCETSRPWSLRSCKTASGGKLVGNPRMASFCWFSQESPLKANSTLRARSLLITRSRMLAVEGRMRRASPLNWVTKAFLVAQTQNSSRNSRAGSGGQSTVIGGSFFRLDGTAGEDTLGGASTRPEEPGGVITEGGVAQAEAETLSSGGVASADSTRLINSGIAQEIIIGECNDI